MNKFGPAPLSPRYRNCSFGLLALILLATPGVLRAQSRPAPVLDPATTAAGPRPVPGPIYEPVAFSRAVLRGTRTRTGKPGKDNWVQHARYRIEARLDPATHRVSGDEVVIYLNNSPDSLNRIMVHLRQNAFAPGAARRQSVALTGGMRLGRVTVNGTTIAARENRNRASPITAQPRRGPATGEYVVNGTVMTIPLAAPLLPGDSLRLTFEWSYSPPVSPADGREGREGNVYFMGYWYPQVAVYDDVDGWVADPYLLEAEFYMDPADYDVRLTVPRGWVVGATGSLLNPQAVLSASARDSLAVARRTARVVRVVTPGDPVDRNFAGTGAALTWHFRADDVRDFAWGSSDRYAWDASRAIVNGGADTVAINSFFRLTPRATAWKAGGARYTRDAIVQLSRVLWPYPWSQMTSMEGVLTSGGMEYPMMTLMTPYRDTLSLAGDLMHETGHMWFPMQVGSNETRHPWMDEGFTQFDVAQAMRPIYGEPRSGGRPNDSEQGQRRLYLTAVRRGNDAPLMWSSGDDYPQQLYFIMQYDKTAQVLVALRGLLGPDLFWRAFREYGHRWIGRHPEPYDFFNTISDVAGRDLSWFWESWFRRAWPLDQAIERVTSGADSTTITVVDRGIAPMPVDLVISRADGSVDSLRIPASRWLDGTRRIAVRVAARPTVTNVVIDPAENFPDIDRRNQHWHLGMAN